MSGIGHKYCVTFSALGTEGEEFMPKCEFCGREHDDNSFELYATAEQRTLEGVKSTSQDTGHVCEQCHGSIIGCEVKVGGHVYCCTHCALLAAPADAKGRIV